jgi:hypothetical protein
MHRLVLAATIVLAACGKPDDGTATDDATTAADTGTTATPTTGTASASTTSGEDSTTGGADATSATSSTSSTSTSGTTTGESGSSTASDEVTGSTIVSATEDESTSLPPGTSTTGDGDGFERFIMNKAAGPCPPNGDCEGFDELLASKLLRVDKFMDAANPVIEVEISDEDFAAAVAVFTDPELIALLGGADPVCDPPTDVFESMLVAVDAAEHAATTTFCMQPPIVAAREMAVMLRDKYAP